MLALRTMTAGAVLCLAVGGCGGGASKQPKGTATTSIAALLTPTTPTTPTTTTPTTTTAIPTTTTTTTTATIAGAAAFATGYEQSWGLMKRVGAEILAAIDEVKREAAKHQTVSNAHIASEFATFAAYLEPGVVGLQGLTPPANVKTAFNSMAASAVQLAASLRSFSSDAAASRGAQGQRDIAAYLAYAAIIDRDALIIYSKLGLK